MLTTTVTLEGNLADDPRVRVTPSGAQITEFAIWPTAAGRTTRGSGSASSPLRNVCKALCHLGENIVESPSRSDRALTPSASATTRPGRL